MPASVARLVAALVPVLALVARSVVVSLRAVRLVWGARLAAGWVARRRWRARQVSVPVPVAASALALAARLVAGSGLAVDWPVAAA
ncbi:hypothetical protein [Mycobacterium stomatepiae]|uniref:hypothetical protein n=1 Tax=Mycobacterium stomatepiae TaxID=470076 RepID=UPI0015D0E9B2|nr:hypothetical protein [Mycobacterium stomatepiae]MCV7168253.1 hypothetical protein [Mycobacterium stomatepiae]